MIVGINLVKNDSIFDKKFEMALENFQKAISIDDKFSISANFGLAWLSIKAEETFF